MIDQADNLIEITVPVGDVGSPPKGTTLTATAAQTFAEVGTPAGGLLEAADNASGGNYKTNKTC